jgi:hypothetical protein
MRADQQRLEDSLDIRDPGRPAQPPTTDAKEAQRPDAPARPNTIAGASADGLSNDLLNRAARAGIAEAEAREYSPALLTKTLDRLERQSYAIDPEPFPFEEPTGFQPQPWQGQPAAPQYQQQPPAPDPRYQPPQQSQLPRLDPEKYEPDLVQAWDAQQQLILRQQQTLEAQQQQWQQWQQQQLAQQQAQAQQVQVQQFRQVEALITRDTDMKDVFGDGPAQRVAPQHIQARAQLAGLMDSLLERGVASDMDSAYRLAKTSLYGQRVSEQTQREISERARNSAGQFISRPTSTNRTNELPHGTDRAIAAVTAAMRHGAAG